jgi:hypothetical protein
MELASGPSWLSYSGQGSGQFNLTCRTADGELPSSGPATFKLSRGSVTGTFEGGSIDGRIADDGTASGRSTGPYGSVTWWGRFRRASDGTLAGQGSVSPEAGSAACSGTWSLP